DGLRGVPPVLGAKEDRGLPLQRARGRRQLPHRGSAAFPRRAPRLSFLGRAPPLTMIPQPPPLVDSVTMTVSQSIRGGELDAGGAGGAREPRARRGPRARAQRPGLGHAGRPDGALVRDDRAARPAGDPGPGGVLRRAAPAPARRREAAAGAGTDARGHPATPRRGTGSYAARARRPAIIRG